MMAIFRKLQIILSFHGRGRGRDVQGTGIILVNPDGATVSMRGVPVRHCQGAGLIPRCRHQMVILTVTGSMQY